MKDWTLFSNHGHVLICLARDNEARLRNVADDVGITERAVQKIVRELHQAGFIAITKHGRCNRYDINTRKALRHDLESKCSIGRLLQLFTAADKRAKTLNAASDAEAGAGPEGLPGANPGPASPQGTESARLEKQKKELVSGQKKKRTDEDGGSRVQKKPIDERQQGSLF